MLQETPRNKGIKLAGKDSFGGTKLELPIETPPTLAELGLDKKTSSIAQKLVQRQNSVPNWNRIMDLHLQR